MIPATAPDELALAARDARSADVAANRRRTMAALQRLAVIGVAVAVGAATHAVPLFVVVVIALLAAVLIAARPDTGALVAVGLIYTNATVIAVNNHGAPGAAATLVPMLLLVTVSFRAFARREPFLLPRAGLWVVALLIAQLLGAMSARDPATSVASVQTFILEGLVLFALVTNAIRGFDMIRLAALILVVAAALLGTLSLVQDVSGARGNFGGFATRSKAVVAKDQGGGSSRHAGPIGEQNRWAQTLAVVLPLALALAITDRVRAVRLIAQVSTMGIIVGIVLTYSRGAVVGLILTGLVAVIVRWIKVKVAISAAVVAVLALTTFAPVFADRATTVVSARSSVSRSAKGSGQDGSISNRTTEAYAAISVFLAHPLIGVGVGLFPSYFQDEARKQGADRIVGVNREAHDLYLGLAAESGVLGLGAFAGLIAALLGPLAAVRRRHLGTRDDVAALATGFSLAVVTYLTTGIFLHFAYIRYFWLLAALAAVMGMVGTVTADPRAGRRRRAVRTQL